MMKYLVPGMLALIMLVCMISPAGAANGPFNLSFSSVKEEGGYITADMSVTTLHENGENDGFLSFWFSPAGGDCANARPLGWQYLPLKQGALTIPMKAAVPYAVIAGTYTLTAVYKPGDVVPSACDTGPAAQTSVSITTPGQGTHDMAGTLTGDSGDSSKPDYRIDSVTGVDTAIRVAPGAKLDPSVTITNTGADDTSGKLVEVHAYLGSDELIPVKATIAPMKTGETGIYTLSYTVPGSIPLRSFPFYLIIDPRGEHGTADAATNLKRTSGQMSIRIEEPDIGCGCNK
jgi:hypothetical protein